MTEKQENILKTALELFAQEGVNAVSTKMIAKQAGVSEGLIFRHFENKEGLLNAILSRANEKANQHFGNIVFEDNPKELIRKLIELPIKIDPSENSYWRLIFALKWQKGNYDSAKMEPLRLALVNAFRQLGYDYPEAEADLLLRYFDGVSFYILLNENPDPQPIIDLLKTKYKI